METKGYQPPIAIHPGKTIKEVLDMLGMSQSELSIRSDLTEKTISEILNGKNPVTPETALKFQRVLGISEVGLLNMQASYDMDLLRLKDQARLESETKFLSKFACYAELVKFGYLKNSKDKTYKIKELLKFFSVNSLEFLEEAIPVAFRKSNGQKINKESLAAWLEIGRIESSKIETNSFDMKLLQSSLLKMRSLTTKKPEIYSRELVNICAESGITLIYTPHLKNTYVNGATRWINSNKSLVQVNLRYKYADIFWFTFFHEIGHVLKHSKKEIFVDFKDSEDISELEKEADQFARDLLIPPDAGFEDLKYSITSGNFAQKILAFSKKIDISPGIVAGRIGKETGNWKLVAQFREKICLTR